MQNKKQKLAVFDIDGTIFRSSLTIEMFKELISKGIFPERALENVETHHTEWRNRKRSYQDFEETLMEVLLKNLNGADVSTVKQASEQMVDRLHQQVYVYTRELINSLKDDGYFLLAISGSPVEVVNSFVSKWGFDDAYAAIWETENDTYTGKVLFEAYRHKKKILTEFIAEREFSLEGSIGVGDTFGDVSFLEMVEQPIAFNPNQELYAVAKERGWKIVVERKDVVYSL